MAAINTQMFVRHVFLFTSYSVAAWCHVDGNSRIAAVCVCVCVYCCILLLKWHQSAKKAITLSEMWQTHVLHALCSLPSVSPEKKKKIPALFSSGSASCEWVWADGFSFILCRWQIGVGNKATWSRCSQRIDFLNWSASGDCADTSRPYWGIRRIRSSGGSIRRLVVGKFG